MAKGRKGKQVKQPFEPNRQKVPKEGANVRSVPAMNFCWRMPEPDLSSRFGWHNVDIRLLFQQIIPKLHDYESMKWSEIEGGHSHFVAFDQLCSDAQNILTKFALDDVEQLFSLRITGKRRVWGMRDGATLNLLWWDPEHEVCPSTKRHT